MQSTWTGGALAWILGLLLLAALGFVMLLRGLCARRVGNTPYCARCNYNLTGTDLGADDARCPECGRSLGSAKAIVIGERFRRWRLLLFGGFLFFLCAIPLVMIGVGAASGVDWQRHKPTGWLIWDLGHAGSPTAEQALAEIERRHVAGTLTARQVRALIDACLREQAAQSPRWIVTRGMMDKLGEPTIESAMTPEQRRCYANNLVHDVKLIVRPRVEAGSEFLVNLQFEGRIPLSRVCPLRIVSLKCNDAELWSDMLIGGASGCGRFGNGMPVRLDQPGPYTFEAVVIAELYPDHNHVAGRGARVLESKPTQVRASTEVFPAGTDPGVQLICSDELDATIEAALRLTDFAASPNPNNKERFFVTGQAHAQPPPPCNLAFDVIIEFDGRSEILDRVDLRPGSAGSCQTWIAPNRSLLGPIPPRVDVRFRGSVEAAIDTPDMFEIWGGELLFENVSTTRHDRGNTALGVERFYEPKLVSRGVDEGSEPSSTTVPAAADRIIDELP